jgi:hypothetical protein
MPEDGGQGLDGVGLLGNESQHGSHARTHDAVIGEDHGVVRFVQRSD